ncbi:conserved membrane hypothetical protein [Flavobacterium sp. 9AF]|uniref:hypothetical protein n=1 Tax=Flavobacterium sp. 9AF TaxID=2653142 RepID=UPI0012F2F02E|nr:hypothetical protein [Flavobacterium sp. 9AF]VXB97262.1 conserved membrane hypothetical protein [Flavobacterium sp. 9AF]
MYNSLLFFHSITRWLLLIGLIYTICNAYKGYTKKKHFTKLDNALRHWTATIAHIQLVIGILLYIKSPIISYFWNNFSETKEHLDLFFFGIIHITMMFIAIVIITIGSALAKRRITPKEQFKTILVWFLIALLFILIAIPWPFSPLANRPYFR